MTNQILTPSHNNKTRHLSYNRLSQASYFINLEPQIARMTFSARLRMYGVKINFKKKYGKNTLCPFCQKCDETFEHIFQCSKGLIFPEELQDTQLVNVADGTYGTKLLHKIGRYLILIYGAKPTPPPPKKKFFLDNI